MATLVSIPGGSVSLSDARRQTERTVELLPYEIATTPITVEEFAAQRSIAAAAGVPKAGVTWLEALRWCNTASVMSGLQPVYDLSTGSPYWDVSADGYRLPTEAEWVHAARAETAGPRYGELAKIGWSAGDEVDGPQPVALKEPNAFGLFDVLGNVWEWCWDRLDPARYGDYRVLKGGGWADPAWSCRVGVRRGDAINARIEDVGLRVARGPVGTQGADGGQGWSETADRTRASVTHPLPVGWTPLRPSRR